MICSFLECKWVLSVLHHQILAPTSTVHGVLSVTIDNNLKHVLQVMQARLRQLPQ